jgi:hypothetical protein
MEANMETSDVVAGVVEDIDAVREALIATGIEVTDVQLLGPDLSPGARLLLFNNRDGKRQALQEVKRS